MDSKPTPQEIHIILQTTYDHLTALYGNLQGWPTDTVFALGEAAGIIAKAKALVGRDIDDKK